jgi:hypothetical protein
MSRQEKPSVVIQFASLTTEHVSTKLWVAAALINVALKSVAAPIAAAGIAPYRSSELLSVHQIVELVRTTILQHSDDKELSKQIADTLMQEDRLGNFQEVQTPEELASLLTKCIRKVSRDTRYQVSYSANHPNLVGAHGRSMYPITEHLSVALPSP